MLRNSSIRCSTGESLPKALILIIKTVYSRPEFINIPRPVGYHQQYQRQGHPSPADKQFRVPVKIKKTTLLHYQVIPHPNREYQQAKGYDKTERVGIDRVLNIEPRKV